jgi:hypothetical protein
MGTGGVAPVIPNLGITRKWAVSASRLEALVGPRVGLDTMERRSICFSCRESNPYSSAIKPVAPSHKGRLRIVLATLLAAHAVEREDD